MSKLLIVVEPILCVGYNSCSHFLKNGYSQNLIYLNGIGDGHNISDFAWTLFEVSMISTH
jgi:hypothetical protein